jgi:hypothetical protein
MGWSAAETFKLCRVRRGNLEHALSENQSSSAIACAKDHFTRWQIDGENSIVRELHKLVKFQASTAQSGLRSTPGNGAIGEAFEDVIRVRPSASVGDNSVRRHRLSQKFRHSILQLSFEFLLFLSGLARRTLQPQTMAVRDGPGWGTLARAAQTLCRAPLAVKGGTGSRDSTRHSCASA